MKTQPSPKLIGVLTVTGLILLLAACATQRSEYVQTDMERALVTSGFRVRTAATAAQRRQIQSLPENQITVVREASGNYYVYPDKRENRLYAGDRWAYRAFKQAAQNNRLRQQGAFVWELNPSDKADDRRIEEWHGWAPFPTW